MKVNEEETALILSKRVSKKNLEDFYVNFAYILIFNILKALNELEISIKKFKDIEIYTSLNSLKELSEMIETCKLKKNLKELSEKDTKYHNRLLKEIKPFLIQIREIDLVFKEDLSQKG